MRTRIESIRVQGFKAFELPAQLELRPLTIVLGRNGAGKSLLTRLPLFLSAGLNGGGRGLPMQVQGFSLGSAFLDLCPGRLPGNMVELQINLAGNSAGVLSVTLGPDEEKRPSQRVWEWRWVPSSGEPQAWTWTKNGDRYRRDEEVFELSLDGLWLGGPDMRRPQVKLPSHLGPFRPALELLGSVPERAAWDVGPNGALAPSVLAAHALLTDDGVLARVQAWFEAHLDFELRVEDISELATGRLFALLVRPVGRRDWVNLANVGTGTATVLPFVVQQALAQEPGAGTDLPDLVVCEEPEAHLHPSAQADLADLGIATAQSGGARVLLETHSETLLLRVRRRVAEGRLAACDVGLVWVDDAPEQTRVVPLNIGDDGWVEDWPEGLFAEASREGRALARALREREA